MATQGLVVSVTSTANNVAAVLRAFYREQLPFATAAALTRTAQDARAEVVRNLPQHFTIRGRRVEQGVRIVRAEKRDWPNPVAKVGTMDEFMALQVTGGRKVAQRGARHVAVPTRLVAAKRTNTGAIPRALKPRPLRERKDVFQAGQTIRRRLGKRTKGSLLNLKGEGTLYNLVPEAKIRPRWPLPTEVETSATSTYGEHFEREFTAAMRSARVRSGSFSSEQGRGAYLAARRSQGRIGP